MKRNFLVNKKLKRGLNLKILKIEVGIYQCAHKIQKLKVIKIYLI